ncbi:MAG: hypothetical protein N3F64_05320 [Nitrososphaeria archaeon]|nr:hypothetical protein [Nitrososphaeria archaeon]
MKTYKIISTLGVILLIVSSFLPWITLHTLKGEVKNFNMIEFYNTLFNYLLKGPSQQILFTLMSNNQLILLSIILYTVSVALALASIAFHKLNLYTGTFCSITGLSWIISIDYNKFSLFETMNLSETSIITIGYGLYSLLLVGIIFFTAFFLEERIVKRPQFNAQISKLDSQIKKLDEKIGYLGNNITSLQESLNRQNILLKMVNEQYEKLYSSLISCRIENPYTVDDKLILEVRNIGALPISWIEIVDIDPRPRNANLPSEKMKFTVEIKSGDSEKFTYQLKDIYGKALIFDPLQTYTAKVLVGGFDPVIGQEVIFKVYGGHLRAEVESVYASGSDLILNLKNVGLLPITQQKILSITPYPGMFANPNQNQIINSGETKALKFSLIDGNFVPGLLYTVGLELSDGINTFTLRFSFVP